MLKNVKCVEKKPKRMRRIGQPAMNECIRSQEITELVMHFGLRNTLPWQQDRSGEDRNRTQRDYREPPVLRETRKIRLYPGKGSLSPTRLGKQQHHANCENDPL